MRVLHWDTGQPADIPNDQVRYSLDDQLGSSLLEVDQAADILTLEEYFPYGGTAVWAGKSLSETQYKFVRYSGKERDATGLYYYGFRYYAPWLGRWLNPDPAGTVDGLNLYRMVGNNPITLYDTDGLMRSSRGRGTGATASGTSRPPIAQSSGSSVQPTLLTSGRRVAATSRATAVTSTAGRGHQVPSRGQPSTTATARGARARGAQGASRTPSLATSAKNDAARKLSTLSIGGAGTAPANDNFYDPNLADRLKNYRAANAERFAAMAEKEFHHQILDDSNPWKILSSENIDDLPPNAPRPGVYENTYRPDAWSFEVNFRNPQVKYYAADVVVDQYMAVAKQNKGFMGHLPKEVSRVNIENKGARELIEKAWKKGSSPEEFFEEFIKTTQNGKSTQRILEIFGVEAYAVNGIPIKNEYNVTMLTRRRANT
jgi:insecticidal toxin complex protein TccC